MAKVIFVNRFFPPDDSATSQLLSELAFSLASVERPIHVIASRRLSDSPDVALPAEETIHGVHVHRVWMTRMGQGRLLGKLLDYLTFYLTATWKLFQQVRTGDLIIVKTDPPMIGYAAAVVARWRRASVVNWLQDLFPEVAEQLKVPWFGGVLARILRVLRDRALYSAQMNVVIGENMRARLVGLGCEPTRICVIPNWSDGTLIQPIAADSNPLRKEWGLDGKFVVGYSGNFGRVHEFATLLDAGERLRDRRDVCFLMIGRGAQYETLRQEVARRKLSNWEFRPFLPRERLVHSLGVADVHLISLKPQLEGLVVPSKFYGVIAAGRPCIYIGDAEGEIAKIVRDHRCGVVVEPGRGTFLAEQIMALLARPAEAQAMGRRARDLFEREFDRQIALERWHETIATLTAGSAVHSWTNAGRPAALSVSAVLYENPVGQVKRLLKSLRESSLDMQIYVVDNSRKGGGYDELLDNGISYTFTGHNLGFGRAHNLAFREADARGSKLHLIVNPDIVIKPGGLQRMVELMQREGDIALLSPRVLYPDGSLQRLCKRLPTPYDMLVRRFGPAWLKRRNNARYELHSFGYDTPAEIPSLTGAFMLVRAEAFRKVSGFDERYFLYMEDIDLCRRIRAFGKTVFYPGAEVVHDHRAGSYDSWRLLVAHVRSSIVYFNRYGWLFDRERRALNRRTVDALRQAERATTFGAAMEPPPTRAARSSQVRM